jgi:hypothetical protein
MHPCFFDTTHKKAQGAMFMRHFLFCMRTAISASGAPFPMVSL